MEPALHDHLEAGWFIPSVDSPEQAARVKASVLQFNRTNSGAVVSETGIDELRWRHDGNDFHAKVGQVLNFYGLQEPVWTILKDESRQLFLVITTTRGAVRGGPVLVGARSVQPWTA